MAKWNFPSPLLLLVEVVMMAAVWMAMDNFVKEFLGFVFVSVEKATCRFVGRTEKENAGVLEIAIKAMARTVLNEKCIQKPKS